MMAPVRRYYHIGSWMIAVVLIAVACSRSERRGQIPEPLPTGRRVHAAGNYLPGDSIEEIVSGGQTRRYRLHIPPGYRPGNPMPLVINLHGLGSSAAWQERMSKMSDKADQAGFTAAYPEALGPPQAWCVGPSTEGGTDIEFIRSLIRRLESQLSIDAARIYVTGFSNGAEMTFRLGCELSDLIAAIAPVSGFYPSPDYCHPVRPVPVVAFHGTADNVLPYQGLDPISLPVREWAVAWAARNACDPTPTVTFQRGWVTGETWDNCQAGADVVLYTVEEGGHSWPGSDRTPQVGVTTHDVNATDAIWEFFAAHPKP